MREKGKQQENQICQSFQRSVLFFGYAFFSFFYLKAVILKCEQS